VAHNFSKVNWVCNETLRQLKHRRVVTSYFNTNYEKDFRQAFAVGDRVRVKYPWRPTVTDGLAYAPQNIDRLETEVVAQHVKGVHFEWDTIDRLLNMERGEEKVRKEYLEPAGLALSSAMDVLAAEYAYQNSNNIFGQLGTNPTTFDATSAAARQRFVELDGAVGKKAILVPPAVMRAIKGGSDGNLARFGPTDEITQLYKEGVVGTADGFEWFESMSLKTHTAGTWQGAVTLNGAHANGATALAVSCTSGDTFVKGDSIGIAAVYAVNPLTRERAQSDTTYTVTVAETTTATAATATVPIQETLYFSGQNQTIDAQPLNGATLTLFPGTTSPNGKSGKQGLALVKDLAFACVCLPLPMPTKEEVVSSAYDDETGLWVGFIRSFDVKERKWINRFDTGLIGFGRLYPESASGRILCK
jgi:hypothetical protein